MWTWLEVVYTAVSWQALFVGLFVMYLSGFYILRSQRDLWEKEFSRKLSEVTGIKGYYEKKITQLEECYWLLFKEHDGDCFN